VDSHNFTDAVVNFFNELILKLRQVAGSTRSAKMAIFIAGQT
jgi:hypothetical protein